MNIEKTDKEIVFKFPLTSKRINPYGTDEENEQGMFGKYPTLTGLIIRHSTHDEDMGFAYTIDMSYKDKGDQVGDFAVMWHGDEDGFREECERLGLSIHEMNI